MPANDSKDRAAAMAPAYFSGAHTTAEIGEYFGVDYLTMSLR